jgi:phosphohistidine phosphatase SixA
MKIILINHAERERHPDPETDKKLDPGQPLKQVGVKQAQELAERLRKVKPTLYLTSKNLHAKQTAEIVCEALGGDKSKDVVVIAALTPNAATETFEQIIEQAELAGCNPGSHDVVAVVGHYPRLNQLFAYLTWQRTAEKTLDKAEEVVLSADSFDDFRRGKGEGQWPKRVPFAPR